MKKLFLLAMVFFVASTLFAQNTAIGKWLTEEGKAIVEVYETGGKYYGKIVWLKTPLDGSGKPKVDSKSDDKTQRTNPIVGLVFLKNFILKDGEWEGGTIYDPEKGKTYKSTMWLKDANTLKVRGYWGFIYRTQVWTRTK